MEELRSNVTQITGAVNALLEKINILERKVSHLDALNEAAASTSNRVNAVDEEVTQAPTTLDDIKEISRLPDCVKELQIFDGNPVQYVSWVHSVESILSDFSVVRDKPLYRAILQHIRQKVRGAADSALISYNIFDSNWSKIKECLSLHYADKRDIRTLEHQLHRLNQRGMKVDEFYAKVNHQFSLILNKIKTESYSEETVRVLIETYRNRALDVFIRGLSGDMSGCCLYSVQKLYLKLIQRAWRCKMLIFGIPRFITPPLTIESQYLLTVCRILRHTRLRISLHNCHRNHIGVLKIIVNKIQRIIVIYRKETKILCRIFRWRKWRWILLYKQKT